MAKKLIAVRLRQMDVRALARIAKREEETVSALIQRAVREFLEKEKQK